MIKFCLLVDIHDLITYATFGDDTADERLFNQILANKTHVLNDLLSPPSVASQNYNLRQRRHKLNFLIKLINS